MTVDIQPGESKTYTVTHTVQDPGCASGSGSGAAWSVRIGAWMAPSG